MHVNNCPRCYSDDVDLNWNKAYGLECQVGTCHDCRTTWNECARDNDPVNDLLKDESFLKEMSGLLNGVSVECKEEWFANFCYYQALSKIQEGQ